MLRFFQKLADPFQSDGDAQPPANVWAYLVHNLKPFRWIIAVSLLFTVLNAGIEVWLIGYAGTLVALANGDGNSLGQFSMDGRLQLDSASNELVLTVSPTIREGAP